MIFFFLKFPIACHFVSSILRYAHTHTHARIIELHSAHRKNQQKNRLSKRESHYTDTRWCDHVAPSWWNREKLGETDPPRYWRVASANVSGEKCDQKCGIKKLDFFFCANSFSITRTARFLFWIVTRCGFKLLLFMLFLGRTGKMCLRGVCVCVLRLVTANGVELEPAPNREPQHTYARAAS